MKKIIIDEKNRKSIEAAICETEGKARCRRIVYSDVVKAVSEIEKKFSFITKKALEGTVVKVDMNAQQFCKSYHGIPESTHFVMVYEKRKWRITDIYRTNCRQSGDRYHVTLSDSAKESIIKAYTYIV